MNDCLLLTWQTWHLMETGCRARWEAGMARWGEDARSLVEVLVVPLGVGLDCDSLDLKGKITLGQRCLNCLTAN